MKKKIIPCMDIKNGKVVKGVEFKNIKELADPVELAKYYNESGADELVFYDISAAVEKRRFLSDLFKEVAQQVDIPLCVGGNICTIEDIEFAIECGANKISINTGAIDDPTIINRAAQKYGSQCLVAAVDVKKNNGKYEIYRGGGLVPTGIDALAWIKELGERGAGEIVINSIDTDGVRQGYDLELLNLASAVTNVPIVASGGAGCKEDFLELFENTNVDSGLAASIFHLKEVEIKDLKSYLNNNNIDVVMSTNNEV